MSNDKIERLQKMYLEAAENGLDDVAVAILLQLSVEHEKRSPTKSNPFWQCETSCELQLQSTKQYECDAQFQSVCQRQNQVK